jgi:hypothetical protein
MNIPLDSAIRDWVLLPIIIFVVLVTYARLYGMRLLSPPPEGHTPIDMKGVQQRSLLAQSQRLRMYGGYISQRGWAMRKTSLVGTPTKGLLDDKAVDANPMASMAGAGSMDMMKMQVRGLCALRGTGGPLTCAAEQLQLCPSLCDLLAGPLSFSPATPPFPTTHHPSPVPSNGQPVWRGHADWLLLLWLCHAAPALFPD